MRKITLMFLSALFTINSSFLTAALPPLYQSAEEIKAIVTHPDLGNYLSSGEMFLDIRKLNDGYLVTTNHTKVFAKIENIPLEGKQGPVQFKVVFQQVQNAKLIDHSSDQE